MSLPVPGPAEHLAPVEFRTERLSGTQLSLCGPTKSYVGRPSEDLRRRMLEAANASAADIIVFDLGRAQDLLSMDIYLDADVAITLSAPEPAAMEQVYAFLRAALFRHLLREGHPAAAVLRDAIDSPKGEGNADRRGAGRPHQAHATQ